MEADKTSDNNQTKYRRAVTALASMLLLLVLIAWVPVSAAGAYERASGSAAPGTVQATPTEDATMTALDKEQRILQVKQIQNQLQNQNNWLINNSTALIAAFTTLAVAFFGLYQWRGNRNDERKKEKDAQDKDLKAQAEERFKTAVAALGDEKEGTQVGGAILLRSFLNKDDKKNYERYYTQVFDLAVAYLRLPRTSHPSEDPDGIPHPPENPNTPLPFTALSRALIDVFKEAFPLARDGLKERKGEPFNARSLDASNIHLDKAFLAKAHLEQIFMPWATLQEITLSEAHLNDAQLWEVDLYKAHLDKAQLKGADLGGSHLEKADLSEADLSGANLWAFLTKANLQRADLTKAKLCSPGGFPADLSGADLSNATLTNADLHNADLSEADLSGARLEAADLSGAKLERAKSLKGTDLRGAKGLTKEQLEFYKEKGAIID